MKRILKFIFITILINCSFLLTSCNSSINSDNPTAPSDNNEEPPQDEELSPANVNLYGGLNQNILGSTLSFSGYAKNSGETTAFYTTLSISSQNNCNNGFANCIGNNYCNFDLINLGNIAPNSSFYFSTETCYTGCQEVCQITGYNINFDWD